MIEFIHSAAPFLLPAPVARKKRALKSTTTIYFRAFPPLKLCRCPEERVNDS